MSAAAEGASAEHLWSHPKTRAPFQHVANILTASCTRVNQSHVQRLCGILAKTPLEDLYGMSWGRWKGLKRWAARWQGDASSSDIHASLSLAVAAEKETRTAAVAPERPSEGHRARGGRRAGPAARGAPPVEKRTFSPFAAYKALQPAFPFLNRLIDAASGLAQATPSTATRAQLEAAMFVAFVTLASETNSVSELFETRPDGEQAELALPPPPPQVDQIEEVTQEVVLAIKKSDVGTLIGRHGSNLRRLAVAHKVLISIDDSAAGSVSKAESAGKVVAAIQDEDEVVDDGSGKPAAANEADAAFTVAKSTPSKPHSNVVAENTVRAIVKSKDAKKVAEAVSQLVKLVHQVNMQQLKRWADYQSRSASRANRRTRNYGAEQHGPHGQHASHQVLSPKEVASSKMSRRLHQDRKHFSKDHAAKEKRLEKIREQQLHQNITPKSQRIRRNKEELIRLRKTTPPVPRSRDYSDDHRKNYRKDGTQRAVDADD